MRTFPADVSYLGAALNFVRNTMKEAKIAHDVAVRVELAAEEAFVNIALYAYGESEFHRDVTMQCTASPRNVSLEFTDNGVPFNPLEREDPDISLDLAGREPGGLGLFIVKKVMDVLEYRREGGKNILYMSKRVT